MNEIFSPQWFQHLVIAAPAMFMAFTVHEFFHAWTALKFGDTTARDLGRVSLNPIDHMDLFGTLALILSGFRFGWAKPVPVDLTRTKNPRVANFWITFAGPLSNLALAIIFGAIYRMYVSGVIPTPSDASLGEAIYLFLQYAVMINCGLCFFNLLPLFPLDGSHIVKSLLPLNAAFRFSQFDSIAPFVLIMLIFTGVVGVVIGPIVSAAMFIVSGIR